MEDPNAKHWGLSRCFVKKSLIVSQALRFFTWTGIAVVSLTPNIPYKGWIAVFLLVLSAPSATMAATILQSANKRFSSRRSRSASFNIWYMVMNLRAMFGGLSVDIVRKTLGMDVSWIFVMGAACAALNIFTALFLIHKTEQVIAEGEETDVEDSNVPKKSGWQTFKELVSQSAFWRFIVLMTSLLGARGLHLHVPGDAHVLGAGNRGRHQREDQPRLPAGTQPDPHRDRAHPVHPPISGKFNVFTILIFFWSIFDQASSTWIYFADNYTTLYFGMAADSLQSLNPILVVVLTPFFIKLWDKIDKMNGKPVHAIDKMMIGFLLVILCMGTMARRRPDRCQHWSQGLKRVGDYRLRHHHPRRTLHQRGRS